MNKCKLSELMYNFLRFNTHRLNILKHYTHKHNTLNPKEVEFLEANDEEEDLVAEEDKSFVIIVDSLEISPEIALILCRHDYTLKNWIILLRNVHS